MPCDTRLKPRQTIQERADEIRRAVGKVQARLIDKRVKIKIGPQGAIAFEGIPEDVRDGLTDACIYRRIMATGSALAKAEIMRAEQIAGRPVNKQAIGQGWHTHDGVNWHAKG